MARFPRCRVCDVPGTWICVACDILERDAKSHGMSLRKLGIMNEDHVSAVRQHEVPMSASKGRYV